jgi:lysophospholipase L1-like esterase
MIATAAALLIAEGTEPRGIVCDPCAPTIVEALRAADPRLTDFGGLCRYRDDDVRLRTSGIRPRVVMFGDSITEGWAKADPGLFRRGVINRGIGGQTSAQMLVRFRQDVIDLKPVALHILAGTNDIAGNTGPTTLETVVANIRSMIELAKAHHIHVILGSVLPAQRFDWAPEQRPAPQIAELNRQLAALARKKDVRFVDYYSAMTNPTGGLDPADAQDGVHPTSAGYAKMRPLVDRAIAGVR